MIWASLPLLMASSAIMQCRITLAAKAASRITRLIGTPLRADSQGMASTPPPMP